jgi:hypothetical protein
MPRANRRWGIFKKLKLGRIFDREKLVKGDFDTEKEAKEMLQKRYGNVDSYYVKRYYPADYRMNA